VSRDRRFESLWLQKADALDYVGLPGPLRSSFSGLARNFLDSIASRLEPQNAVRKLKVET